MTDADRHALPVSHPSSRAPADTSEAGWYLYGVTTRAVAEAVPPASLESWGAGPGARRGGPPEFLECGELVAVVRRTATDEFPKEPGEDEALAALVSDHNSVVAAVHREGPILPAKFGLVYADRRDLEMALEQMEDLLRDRLRWLEGRDEWAVHVYADRPAVRESLAATDPDLRRLGQQVSAATPGRAYLLERRLSDRLDSATRQLLDELAQAAYDHLSEIAVEGRLSPYRQETEEAEEILRAAFLVDRESSDRFLRELGTFADGHEHVSCEYSGPWPPYSFALVREEDLS